MNRFTRLLERWAVPVLIRLACVLVLAALCLTMLAILWPRPLIVMASASVGPGLILLALGCYVLAVFADSMRDETSHAAAPRTTDDGRR